MISWCLWKWGSAFAPACHLSHPPICFSFAVSFTLLVSLSLNFEIFTDCCLKLFCFSKSIKTLTTQTIISLLTLLNLPPVIIPKIAIYVMEVCLNPPDLPTSAMLKCVFLISSSVCFAIYTKFKFPFHFQLPCWAFNPPLHNACAHPSWRPIDPEPAINYNCRNYVSSDGWHTVALVHKFLS